MVALRPGATPPPLLAAVAVLASVLATGEAIQCYTCNSVTESSCADPFRADASAFKVHCTPDAVQRSLSEASQTLSDVLNRFGVDVPTTTMELAFVCQKVKQTDKSGHEVVLRSCAFNPDTVNACPPENTGAQCLQCSTDLCNGAVPGPSTTVARLLVLVALPAAALRLLRP